MMHNNRLKVVPFNMHEFFLSSIDGDAVNKMFFILQYVVFTSPIALFIYVIHLSFDALHASHYLHVCTCSKLILLNLMVYLGDNFFVDTNLTSFFLMFKLRPKCSLQPFSEFTVCVYNLVLKWCLSFLPHAMIIAQ